MDDLSKAIRDAEQSVMRQKQSVNKNPTPSLNIELQIPVETITNDENGVYLWTVIFIGAVILLGVYLSPVYMLIPPGVSVLFFLWKSLKVHSKTENFLQTFSPTGTIPVGVYVAGFGDLNGPISNVLCYVNDSHYAFMSAGSVFQYIPRGSLEAIQIADKSTVSQRITATRILALGIFSLAFPKKTKTDSMCLLLEWKNAQNIKQETLFEFTGPDANNMAYKALNSLNQLIVR